MKFIIFVLSLGILILGSISLTDNRHAATTLINYLDYEGYKFYSSEHSWNKKPFTMSYFIVNPEISPVGVISPKALEERIGKNNFNAYTIEEFAKLGEYRIAQSGGFMSSFTPPTPLGYLKIRGVEYNKTHISWLTTGLFCTNGNLFSIGRFVDENQYKKWITCTQAGPIAIENYQNVLNTDRNTWYITGQSHRQSFLCEDKLKKLVMGIAENISLKDLSEFLVSPNFKEFQCKNMIALNPKGIAGIYNAENENKIGTTDTPIATAIIVR